VVALKKSANAVALTALSTMKTLSQAIMLGISTEASSLLRATSSLHYRRPPSTTVSPFYKWPPGRTHKPPKLIFTGLLVAKIFPLNAS
jgi:hypothetical protein